MKYGPLLKHSPIPMLDAVPLSEAVDKPRLVAMTHLCLCSPLCPHGHGPHGGFTFGCWESVVRWIHRHDGDTVELFGWRIPQGARWSLKG